MCGKANSIFAREEVLQARCILVLYLAFHLETIRVRSGMITFIHKVTPIHAVVCCIGEKFIINRDNAEGLTCCCGRSCPARRWREYSEGGPGRIDTCAVVIREMLNKRRLFRSHLEYTCPSPVIELSIIKGTIVRGLRRNAMQSQGPQMLGIFIYFFGVYVSRLILRPNLAYNWTFNSVISSRTVLSFSPTADSSSSILLDEVESISWTSGSGNEMNESPILYL
jgi:hypothetical protein